MQRNQDPDEQPQARDREFHLDMRTEWSHRPPRE